MSEDYVAYQDGKLANLENLLEVISGNSQDGIQDHSYLVLSEIPVLLKSNISIEMRTSLLRQYTEIKGHTRDISLGALSRSDFYSFARKAAIKEIEFSKERKADITRNHESLKRYLEPEEREDFDKMDQEHKILKSALANVIKSQLGIPEDKFVGHNEVIEFLQLQNSNSLED